MLFHLFPQLALMKITKGFKFIGFFFGSLLNSFKAVMYFLTFKLALKNKEGLILLQNHKIRFCCKSSEKAQKVAISFIFRILQSLYFLRSLRITKGISIALGTCTNYLHKNSGTELLRSCHWSFTQIVTLQEKTG